MTTILICDERRPVVESLARVLGTVPGVSRIGALTRDEELPVRHAREHADVVLVGLREGSYTAVEATRKMMELNARSNILVFGAPHDSRIAVAAIAQGARGYLRWDTAGVAPARQPAPARPPAPSEPRSAALSDRELQVLHGMSQGQSNSEIGRSLFLAEDTVKTHARRLFRKLGANDRAQAVAHGFRRGLLT